MAMIPLFRWYRVIGCAVVLVLTVILGTSGAVSAAHVSPAHSQSSEVLTLWETAQFLRISLREAVRLVNEGRLPGKKVGKYWRFRRSALEEWLSQTPHEGVSGNRSQPDQAKSSFSSESSQDHSPRLTLPFSSDSSTDRVMDPMLLPRISGRGTAGTSTPSAEESGDQIPPDTIGEDPDLATADEMFLRDQQVLLNQNQATLELGFFYSKTEQDGLTVLPISSLPVLASTIGEQDLFIWNFTARYGLPYDTQFFATLPLLHSRQTITASVPNSTIRESDDQSLTETGDFVFGLRRTMVKERVGWPDIILSVEGQIPTRKSSYGIGGGLTLVKRLDPVVLFANGNYRYIFNREFSDVTRLQPEHLISGQLGYAISLNDSVAVSTSVSGTFTTRTTFEDSDLPPLNATERFSIRLSLTALLAEGLYVEPSVGFSLNGPNRLTLGFTLPYTFDVPPLPVL